MYVFRGQFPEVTHATVGCAVLVLIFRNFLHCFSVFGSGTARKSIHRKFAFSYATTNSCTQLDIVCQKAKI